jgi:hypothetical protein
MAQNSGHLIQHTNVPQIKDLTWKWERIQIWQHDQFQGLGWILTTWLQEVVF